MNESRAEDGRRADGDGDGDELVRSATLYTRRPRLLHGTVLPFLALLYPAWLYAWLGLYGSWSWSWGSPGQDPQDQDPQQDPQDQDPQQDPHHPPTEAALLALAAVVIAHVLTGAVRVLVRKHMLL
ncbi:hypothetical protein CRUP_036757 [Coryphaenoides rupestris]|nr:hypothetical protein CRUP_036757 [Coryphaenoides rupestris]